MGLDTISPTTLWKDRAVIELNAAVLYSFQVLFHNENYCYLDLPILFKYINGNIFKTNNTYHH